MYKILIVSDDINYSGNVQWREMRDGQYGNFVDARAFASAEVGVPWIIVGPIPGMPLAYGDARGELKL